MRKVEIAKAGGTERLRLVDAPAPPVRSREVRVVTRACGVNFADVVVRMGLYPSALEYVGWPITPGFEVSGVVAEVGEGVTRVRVGDDVIAVTRFGGYATEVVVPESGCFPRPAALDAIGAAGFPAIHLTAFYALHVLGAVTSGSRVLVHSAAGGVGSAAVRLAKTAGAFVVGVVSGAHKVDAAKEAGADVVIDKRAARWDREARRACADGFDAVLDANGHETLRRSYDHLAPAGRLVVYGFHTMLDRGGRGRPNWPKLALSYARTPRFDPLRLTNDNKSVMGFNLSYLFPKTALLHDAMSALFAQVEGGVLPMPPVTAFPLDRVADAHHALESGETVGKLVLTT